MHRFLPLARRTSLWCLLLVMPLGAELEEGGDGQLTVGVHGGVGEIATVARGCGGTVIDSWDHSYEDSSAMAEYRHRIDNEREMTVGVRAGRFDSQLLEIVDTPPTGERVRRQEAVRYEYLNPYLSFDTGEAGFGLGGILGRVPLHYDPGKSTNLRVTGHLRAGSMQGFHFLVSLGEATPLLSGGGFLRIGAGYRLGRLASGMSGISTMFYEEPGVFQQLSLDLTRHATVDLAGRAGKVGPETELGVSVGLRLKFATP